MPCLTSYLTIKKLICIIELGIVSRLFLFCPVVWQWLFIYSTKYSLSNRWTQFYFDRGIPADWAGSAAVWWSFSLLFLFSWFFFPVWRREGLYGNQAAADEPRNYRKFKKSPSSRNSYINYINTLILKNFKNIKKPYSYYINIYYICAYARYYLSLKYKYLLEWLL